MDENQKVQKPDSPADEQEDVNALMQFPEDPAATVHRMYPVSSKTTPALTPKGAKIDNLPEAPKRQQFANQETFEEAMGFWQSRVGRLRGMRGVTRMAPSPDSPGEPELSPPQPPSRQLI